LPIFDCRLPITDGHCKKLPHHFFNRQSAIGNENLVSGCGYAALRPGHMEVSSREQEKPCEPRGFGHRLLAGLRAPDL
jgi:hypothetical protein